MKRRLFHILAAFSSLLFVAIVGMWVRSYWVQDGLLRYSAMNAFRECTQESIYSRSGFLSLEATYRRDYYPGWEPDEATGWFPTVRKLPAGAHAAYILFLGEWGGSNLLGLRWGIDEIPKIAHISRLGNIDRRRFVVIPYWMVVLVTGLVPAWWIGGRRNRRRQQRRERGLCPNCSYDLRAHLPGSKCPECGTLISSRIAP